MAGSEQGIEAGQVGIRVITKGDRQTTVAREWSISATSIADGRFVLPLSCFSTVCLVLSHRMYIIFICFPLCCVPCFCICPMYLGYAYYHQ